MCNSELSQDAYFDTLGYMHRKVLPMMPQTGSTSSNPFFPFQPSSSPDEAANDLRNVSANLLVNGYYARFFSEVRRLGTGSFGSVYLCQHVIDSVFWGEFAVKKVPVGDSREWLRGMMKEVKALERLASHPNIVCYKHSWLEMSRSNELCPYVPFLFILMSYCDSGSLESFIWGDVGGGDLGHQRKSDQISLSDETPLDHHADKVIWALFLDITQGLQHLHRNFVLHRDLKPSNVLLARDPGTPCGIRAVLSDFGTAEIAGDTSTHTGFSGTVEYTAPEVLADSPHNYSEESDLWSLGILLYALCYSSLPYSDPNPSCCADRVRQHEQLILPLCPDRDPNLRDIIQALTAKDPALRPSCNDILFHPIVRSKFR